MSGKYVLAPRRHSSDDDDATDIMARYNNAGRGWYIDDIDSTDVGATEVVESIECNTNVDDRLSRLEALIEKMSGEKGEGQRSDAATVNPSNAETFQADPPRKNEAEGIRVDKMPVFPENVPGNRLWEAWRKFIGNFEIATKLSRIEDPTSRCQLLYLQMGDRLQSIVETARLMPDLERQDCYVRLVKSVGDHLKGLSNVKAERATLASMKQRKGEKIADFHARVTEQVYRCDYASDWESFVLARLLDGMEDQEMARICRLLDHDANAVVKAVSQEETQPKQDSFDETPKISVAAVRERKRGAANRTKENGGDNRWKVSRSRELPHGGGRRSRCKMCHYPAHRNGQGCPAATRNCRSCGRRGHFAVACQRKQANAMFEEEDVDPEEIDVKEKV